MPPVIPSRTRLLIRVGWLCGIRALILRCIYDVTTNAIYGWPIIGACGALAKDHQVASGVEYTVNQRFLQAGPKYMN